MPILGHKSRQQKVDLAISFLLLLLFPLSYPPEKVFSQEWKNPAVLGYWQEIQGLMNRNGVIVQTINTLDVLSNVSGGKHRKTSVTGDLDLLLTLNTERLLKWEGGNFFLYGLGLYGDNPSQYVGDAQTVSNIAAPNNWKLFEAWYQQNLFNQRISLLGGLYDVTSEFDVLRSSSELFLNSSFGTGPEFASSGLNGPLTFPTTSLALRVQAILYEDIAFRAVIADGVPGDPNNPDTSSIKLKKGEGIFFGGELAYYDLRARQIKDGPNSVKKGPVRLVFRRIGRAAPLDYQGKYAIGVWGYTTDFDDLSSRDRFGKPIKRESTHGVYGLAEHIVYRERQDPAQNLTLFARIGFADPRVNRFSRYIGGGLVYRGLFPQRYEDTIGIGVAAAFNGSHFKQAQRSTGQRNDDAEIALEVTYALNILPEMVLQPNVQYIINPDTDPELDNAIVLGVRLEINLNWFEGPTTSVEIQK